MTGFYEQIITLEISQNSELLARRITKISSWKSMNHRASSSLSGGSGGDSTRLTLPLRRETENRRKTVRHQ
jgi:hypothetical protein